MNSGEEIEDEYPDYLEMMILTTLLLGRESPSLAMTHCIVGRSVSAYKGLAFGLVYIPAVGREKQRGREKLYSFKSGVICNMFGENTWVQSDCVST